MTNTHHARSDYATDPTEQQWFSLSGRGVEENLYDLASMRQFVGIDFGWEATLDESMVFTFRHLLEKHQDRRRLHKERGDGGAWINALCDDNSKLGALIYMVILENDD